MYFSLLQKIMAIGVSSFLLLSHSVSMDLAGVDTLEDKEIEREISEMSVKEKIGQLIIMGILDKELQSFEKEILEDHKVGGILYLGSNIENHDQFIQLVEETKMAYSTRTEAGNIPPILFEAIDQEGGRVQRLPMDHTLFPSAKKIGENPETAYEQGVFIGESLKTFGLNLNFAPVLDIQSNPENTVIGDRAFGTTAEKVSDVGVKVLRGMQSAGIIGCVKHFPGHGDTNLDSHLALPIVAHDIERLETFEWVPFQSAIDNGVDMIMTAHILIPSLDEEVPATLSKTILQDYLREKLKYNGVIITDDLAMGAISNTYAAEEAALKALSAGADIVLVSDSRNIKTVYDRLYEAYQNGDLTEERLNQSLKRILIVKNKILH